MTRRVQRTSAGPAQARAGVSPPPGRTAELARPPILAQGTGGKKPVRRGRVAAELALGPGPAAALALNAGGRPHQGARLVSMSSVEALIAGGDLSSLDPPLPRALWPYAELMLRALGPEGVLSAYGPAGPYGPVGPYPWNPSSWMRALGDWSALAERMTRLFGPLSGAGSLGPFGADAGRAWLSLMPPLGGQLAAGGLFAVLGPDGPLGPRSGLGVLGPVGGHGFSPDAQGQYRSARGVERRTDVEQLGGKRSFELVELHPEAFAADRIGDASWVVRGQVDRADTDGDLYRFSTGPSRSVTLAAIPERLGEHFALELLGEDGRVLGVSDSRDRTNWIQLELDGPRSLAVRVRRLDLADGSGRVDPLRHPLAAYLELLLAPLVGASRALKGDLAARGVATEQHIPSGGYRLACVPSAEGFVVTGRHQRGVE